MLAGPRKSEPVMSVSIIVITAFALVKFVLRMLVVSMNEPMLSVVVTLEKLAWSSVTPVLKTGLSSVKPEKSMPNNDLLALYLAACFLSF